ncbi:MAG: hypothetical protein QM652_06805 [Legionella sp.]|uniref:hypothetical protein n=1 Tax=Legionella sp. TaxID=459 RepID=UPI0039E53FF2
MNVKQQYLIVVKPKPAIKTWLKKIFISKFELPTQIEQLDFSLLERDATVYLLPQSVDSVNKCTEFLVKKAAPMLEFELEQFIKDEKLWPEKRSFNLFSEWFEFEVLSRVLS